MIENNETTGQEAQPEAQPAKPKGISKTVWIVGCGLLLVIGVIAAALSVYAYFYFFGSGDPIAKVVPADSLVYMSTDLTKTQSERFIEIFNIFQEIADQKVQTPTEMLDEYLKEELDMNFAEHIMPWIGKHTSFVITDGDFQAGDIQMMFIVETINKGNADEFVVKLTDALDKKQSKKFEQSEKDGVTLYTYKGASRQEDIFITRSGSFVYISNSEETLFESIKLSKADSLASSENYKATLAALPKNRFTTIYINGEKYFELLQSMAGDLSGATPLPLDESMYGGLTGIGLAVSAEDAGLRMDTVTIVDEENLGDFQKNSFNAVLSAPTTVAMVPEDTFLWFGVNSTLSFADLLKEDSPFYTPDVQESFDLLEQQYNIDIPELFGTFGGEFAMAVGPARDGLIAQTGGVNIGMEIIASVTDEQGFNAWFDNLASVASAQMGTELKIENVTIGSYTLQEVSAEAGLPAPTTILFYGADNGYGFLSSSHSMLEDGLEGGKTLATNETYIKTWTAFPSGSIPYMYLDVNGLMDLIVESSGSSSEMLDIQKKLEKMPIVAFTLSRPSTYVQSATMIAFMETKLKP